MNIPVYCQSVIQKLLSSICNHFPRLRFCKWWTRRPRPQIFPLTFFYLDKTVPQKWLNPSLDYLIPHSLDDFGLTFSPVALQMLALFSTHWPHTPLHFYRTYLFLHMGPVIICFQAWMLLLQGLDIWTVKLWRAHRPVFREARDNSKDTMNCHSFSLYFMFFQSVLLLTYNEKRLKLRSLAIYRFVIYGFHLHNLVLEPFTC